MTEGMKWGQDSECTVVVASVESSAEASSLLRTVEEEVEAPCY